MRSNRCVVSICLFLLLSHARTLAITPVLGAALVPAVGFLVSSGMALKLAVYSALGLAGVRLAESVFDVEIISHQSDGEVVEQAETVLAQLQLKYDAVCALVVSDEIACVQAAARQQVCLNVPACNKELLRVDQELARLLTRLETRRRKLMGYTDHFSVQLGTEIDGLKARTEKVREQLQKLRLCMCRHATYFELYEQLEALKKRLDVFVKHEGTGYTHALCVKDRGQVHAIANKARICAYLDLLSTSLELEQTINTLHPCAG